MVEMREVRIPPKEGRSRSVDGVARPVISVANPSASANAAVRMTRVRTASCLELVSLFTLETTIPVVETYLCCYNSLHLPGPFTEARSAQRLH